MALLFCDCPSGERFAFIRLNSLPLGKHCVRSPEYAARRRKKTSQSRGASRSRCPHRRCLAHDAGFRSRQDIHHQKHDASLSAPHETLICLRMVSYLLFMFNSDHFEEAAQKAASPWLAKFGYAYDTPSLQTLANRSLVWLQLSDMDFSQQ